jgi:hypothetical protein
VAGCEEVDEGKSLFICVDGRLHSDFFKGMERYILKYGECADKN